MSSPEKKPSHRSDTFRLIAGTIVFITAFLVAYELLLRYWFPPAQWEKRGIFGDQFGGLTSLFSALSFIGLIAALVFQAQSLRQQSEDLKSQQQALGLQTEALKLQIDEAKEQKAEMARAAAAQEEANELARAMIVLELAKHELHRSELKYTSGEYSHAVTHFLGRTEGEHRNLLEKLARFTGRNP